MLSFKPTFSLSTFTFLKRLFSSSSLSAKRMVSSAYLRLLIFLLAILIPACASSSPAFLRDAADPAARQGDRKAHRPDRSRRIAHVRHGGSVPPARHLEPARPALHAGGPRAADVLQGGQARPDPPGRHQRGGRDVRLHGGGERLLDTRRA